MNRQLELNKRFKVAQNHLTSKNTVPLEITLIVVLLIIFLLLNLVTSGRDIAVWLDEVMFVDPAANLYLGNGFTSSAWWFQTKDQFWAGNVPLYSIILYHWMKIFGFSLEATRSLNYVFMIISGLMLWLSVFRLKLIASAWGRITLVALLLSGQSISISYRGGRYDSLSIILLTACMLVYSIELSWLRCVLLSCIGIFIPTAGLQLLPFAIILCSLIVVFLGKSFLKESISLAIGSIIGIIFLYILYSTNGAWITFLKSTAGTQSIIGQIAQVIIQRDYNAISRFAVFPDASNLDYSFILLFALAVAIAVHQIINRSFRLHSLIVFGITVSICIPLAMFILGKYPPYYSWMAFVPLAICVCSESESLKVNRNSWQRLIVSGVLVLVCLIGWPRQLVVSLHNWNNSDYAPVEALVERNVKESDWVYCDFGAYFAAKKKAAVVMVPSYATAESMHGIPSQEKTNVSILIIEPLQLKKVVKRLGGKWYPTGDGLNLNAGKYYPYQIFRRDTNS